MMRVIPGRSSAKLSLPQMTWEQRGPNLLWLRDLLHNWWHAHQCCFQGSFAASWSVAARTCRWSIPLAHKSDESVPVFPQRALFSQVTQSPTQVTSPIPRNPFSFCTEPCHAADKSLVWIHLMSWVCWEKYQLNYWCNCSIIIPSEALGLCLFLKSLPLLEQRKCSL